MFLIEEKEEIARNRVIKEWADSDVQVLNGRFGPPSSATASSTAKIPKDREPASLTLEEVQLLLAETGKPARRGFGAKKAAAKKAVTKKAPAEKETREEGGGEEKSPRRPRRKPWRRSLCEPAPRAGQAPLTAGKVEVGKKRVIKPAREDAPF